MGIVACHLIILNMLDTFSFLFTSVIVHGSVPTDFVTSTIIPIPKKKGAADSDNYHGIALSSMFLQTF